MPHDVGVYIMPGTHIVSPRMTVQVRYGTDTVPAFPLVFLTLQTNYFIYFKAYTGARTDTVVACWMESVLDVAGSVQSAVTSWPFSVH